MKRPRIRRSRPLRRVANSGVGEPLVSKPASDAQQKPGSGRHLSRSWIAVAFLVLMTVFVAVPVFHFRNRQTPDTTVQPQLEVFVKPTLALSAKDRIIVERTRYHGTGLLSSEFAEVDIHAPLKGYVRVNEGSRVLGEKWWWSCDLAWHASNGNLTARNQLTSSSKDVAKSIPGVLISDPIGIDTSTLVTGAATTPTLTCYTRSMIDQGNFSLVPAVRIVYLGDGLLNGPQCQTTDTIDLSDDENVDGTTFDPYMSNAGQGGKFSQQGDSAVRKASCGSSVAYSTKPKGGRGPTYGQELDFNQAAIWVTTAGASARRQIETVMIGALLGVILDRLTDIGSSLPLGFRFRSRKRGFSGISRSEE